METISLSDRIKSYEDSGKNFLDTKQPIIIRIDGCKFSKLTKSFKKPYDDNFIELMNKTAEHVISKIENFRFCAVQSDEINICMIPSKEETQALYNGSINKIVSVTASAAASAFNILFTSYMSETPAYAMFDSRAFNIPREECFNYFLSRQNDTTRNAIAMTARTYFSHKEVLGKDSDQMKEMLNNINKSFDDIPDYFKYGRFMFKEKVLKQNPMNTLELVERSELKSDSFKLLDKRDFVESYFK